MTRVAIAQRRLGLPVCDVPDVTLPDALADYRPELPDWELLGVHPQDIADLVALMRGNVEKF